MKYSCRIDLKSSFKIFEEKTSDFSNHYYQYYYIKNGECGNVNDKGNESVVFIISFLIYILTIIISFFKFFIIRYKGHSNDEENLIVLNCNSSWSKINKYLECQNISSYSVLYDDMRITPSNFKAIGIVSSINKTKRLSIICTTIFKKGSFSNLISQFNELSQERGDKDRYLFYIAKRHFHHELYKASLYYILSKKKNIKNLISGSTNERYAISMERLCNELGIRTICIPHGISVSYRLPHGLFGQTYFCLSKKEKIILESLYPSKNVLFDRNVVKSIMNVNPEKGSDIGNKVKKIVVFTDSRSTPRDQELMNLVSECCERFYVKLHPNDKLSNYNVPSNGVTIESFKDAICNSICVTRVSTILLDALYNNSIPIAYLGSEYDKYSSEYVYSGLFTDEVKILYTRKKLSEFLHRGLYEA